MKVFILGLVLSRASPVLAATNCHSSERFGGRLVQVGDSERKVIQSAGSPDREANLENGFGAGVGYRLYYYQRGKTVRIDIQNGVGSQICVGRD